jgi:sugar O-acyltransferase (sialic acid O-acetyltransferase NeuD family)
MLDIVEAVNSEAPTWNVLGLLADDQPHDPERIKARGVEIIAGTAAIDHIDAAFVIGIGSPAARQRIDALLLAHGREAATLRHPSAVVASEVVVGEGCVLAANSIVTTNIRLGRHVHVNIAASVSHDCTLGDYTTLAPGVRLAGNVTTGIGVDIGIGAVARPGITIGDWARVGAGAAVVSDVEGSTLVAGVPARPLRQ